MENFLFIIQRINGYDCKDETKTIVATRHTTKKAIEEEVDRLNNVMDGVEMPEPGGFSWNYFDFEELVISAEGEYEKFILSSKKDAVLNMVGLRNDIKRRFDATYSYYMSVEYPYSNKTLESYLKESYSSFLSGDTCLSDLLNIAEELQCQGIIKSDVSVIRNSLKTKK